MKEYAKRFCQHESLNLYVNCLPCLFSRKVLDLLGKLPIKVKC